KAIQQAINKATKELMLANEEQRLALEQKIAELQLKYEEAGAKNQRAISMAQQTRSGHVYIISNIGSFGEDVYKIGMTR
ncbi:GIY-YIG nuclease family protein, partial [Escherichia coli]|nr:GIY-YIG nuclease family protein [Escherichia coli]